MIVKSIKIYQSPSCNGYHLYIDTTKECEGKIKEKTKFLIEQGLKVTVSSELLVENNIARLRLGLPFYEVMQRCYRDNAIYINLPPDHIIGNGLFEDLIINAQFGFGKNDRVYKTYTRNLWRTLASKCLDCSCGFTNHSNNCALY